MKPGDSDGSGPDVLRIPRRDLLGRLLDRCAGFPGVGAAAARFQRVRRKRFSAALKGASRNAKIGEVRQSEAGRNCDAALKEWAQTLLDPRQTAPLSEEPADGDIRCSVVINTVDRSAELGITLEALKDVWAPDLDELIIVLGPTADDSVATLQKSGVPHRLLRCSERNLAVSRNIGLQAASGRYVAFLDDDASPEPGWLEELVAPFEEDARTAVSAGFVMDGAGARFLNQYVVADALGRAQWFADEKSAHAEIARLGVERGFLTATGCNMAFRREVLLRAGGFDPAYRYFLEETDAVLAVGRLGFLCKPAPRSRVRHRLGANIARTPSFEIDDRVVLVRSQIHYIGKFGKAAFPPAEIEGCLWERMLADLEKIAWDCASEPAAGNRCGTLQRSYLQAVEAELRLDMKG